MHILSLAAILTLLAAPMATAETPSETPGPTTFEAELFSTPETGCGDAGTTATPGDLVFQQPHESSGSNTFYVCLSSDILCGGCDGGTRCATEAYNLFAPCCNFVVSCVFGCQVTPGCTSICE